MKILIVFGTRPEAIKMAPVVMALKRKAQVETKVCITAQHRDLLDQVLKFFGITPDYDLNVMKENQDLYDITSGVLTGMGKILEEWKPDAVLVHGDTTTTLSAALGAFYKKIPIGHVEAGLRTGDIYSPWPEEGNRKIIADLAQWNFAPTHLAKDNLIKEGVPEEKISVTGNTIVDSINYITNKISSSPEIENEAKEMVKRATEYHSIVLITAHRRENFGQGIVNISVAVKILSQKYKETAFIWPVHPNPNIREPVKEITRGISNIFTPPSIDYPLFVHLMRISKLVMTDSGGVQEEAVTLGVPLIIMRDKTERSEAINLNFVEITGTKTETIIRACQKYLSNQKLAIKPDGNPFGDGHAAERISEILIAGIED